MQKVMKRYGVIFVGPVLIAFIVAFIIPFVSGMALSFCEFRTVTDVSFVGMANYIEAVQSEDFWSAMLFSVKFMILAVMSVNIFAFMLALLLTKGIKGSNFFRTVYFMPNLIGGIVLGYIWQSIINGILFKFDLTMLMDAKYGFWGMVILTNWQMIGYIMIIYIAGIQNIPGELIEAAKIDGAGSRKILTKITIPLMMPSIVISLFMTITNTLKTFDSNLALTGGGPGKQTAMLALDIYNTFYNRVGSEGVGQAKAVLFFVIVGMIAITQVIITRKKEVDA